MKPLKFCHGEGHTDVCYDSSGEFILTSGANGELCFWEGTDDTDTTSIKIGEELFALAFQDGRAFTSTAGNLIQIRTFPDGVSDGIATRFMSPCRHFCFSKDGKILVAGSDEFRIKVISMEDQDCNCVFTGHQAPILSVAVDPTGEFVASSSCDGTVKVWNATDGATEMSLDLLTPCNHSSQSKSLCRICWSHDGEFLLVPVKNTVQILLRSSWAVTQTIESTQLTEVINVMSLSENGQFIAVGCVNGEIGIFDWQKRSLIEKHSHPKNLTITSVAWNPKKPTELAFCDKMGQLGFLENLQTAPKGSTAVSETSQTANGVFDEMDDDMLVSASHQPGTDLNEDFDIDDENSIDIGSIKKKYNFGDDDDDDTESTANKADPFMSNNIPVMPDLSQLDIFKPTPLQGPFQSGSTPEHFSNRFMVWNDVGIVRQNVSDEDGENSIDVEFHNTATHHALHIDNNSDFVMADLSTQVLLLASRGDEETPSKLMCMHFGSWDNDKEWSFNMPDSENIQAITATDKWIAIASESRTIRIFTVGGMQCQLFTIPGNVVGMASQSDKLTVVYHKGMGVPGDQFMGVLVLKVTGSTRNALVKDETLPLSPKSRLSWLGFTDEGIPMYMDTEGVVRLLHKGFNQLWCPVANTHQKAKGMSDHFWVVGANLARQQIRCIPCKGSRYPATLPRPALSILSFELPLCDIASEKSSYEESYQRNLLVSKNLLSTNEVDSELEHELRTSLRESVIKLFALAAKGEKDFRALEVCEMIEEQDVLEIAATYATRLRRVQLVERVNEIISKRQTMTVQDEDDEDNVGDLWNTVDTDGNAGPSERDGDNDLEVEEDISDTGYDGTESSGTMLRMNKERTALKSTPQQPKNPFKVFSSLQSGAKGSQVFDKMQKPTLKPSPVITPLPINLKKSGKKMFQGSNQGKLTGFGKADKPVAVKKESNVSVNVKKESDSASSELSENQPIKKKISAFDLWCEANKEDMREEHPDLSEEDLGQKAAEAFRALPKDERQIWVQKAKTCSASNEESVKKRKLSNDDTTEETTMNDNTKTMKSEKKTPLSQSTNAKLAKFAKFD